MFNAGGVSWDKSRQQIQNLQIIQNLPSRQIFTQNFCQNPTDLPKKMRVIATFATTKMRVIA